MSSKNFDNSDKNDLSFNKKINDLKEEIKIMKLMKHITRFRLIWFLLIYPKLSLTELSNYLDRSKPAVTHHLTKLETLNLIKTTTKEARGSIDAKIYEISHKFNEISSFYFKNDKDSKRLDRIELLKYTLQRDIFFFEMLKTILEYSKEIYEHIDENIQKNDQDQINSSNVIDYNNLIHYDTWLLNEAQRKKYEGIYLNFKNEIKKLLTESEKTDGTQSKPYLILHSTFPIKDINEYDPEKKIYKKFFNALE